ncbi:MAG: hypothetical protein V1659_00620 [Candidatus Woesearchaeota archaeon]
MGKTIFSKKAIMSEMPKLVLAVITLLILVIAVGGIYSKMHKGLEQSDCEREVEKHVVLMKAGQDAVVSDIYCPTTITTIEKEKTDVEKIRCQLADELKLCWKEWQRGKEELFKEDDGFFCHVCSIIEFENPDLQVDNFQTFLMTRNMPGTNEKYMTYLSSFSTEHAEEMKELNLDITEYNILDYEPSQGKDAIYGSKKYAAVFLYAKGKDSIKHMQSYFQQAKEHQAVYYIGFGTLAIGGATTAAGISAAGGVMPVIISSLSLGTFGSAAAATGAAITGVGLGVVVAGAVIVGGMYLYDEFIADDGVEWIAHPVFMEWNDESIINLGCDISPAKQQREEGLG